MEDIEEKKIKKRYYNSIYRKNNIDKIRKKDLEYKNSGRRKIARDKDVQKQKINKRAKVYYQNNKEKKSEYNKSYRVKAKEKEKQNRINLSDSYIIKVIKKQSKYTIEKKEITKEQIEFKRIYILLNRIIKQLKEKENGI